MIRRATPMLLALTLSACATTAPERRIVTVRPPPPPVGLERVIGKDARALQMLFGEPDQDLRENTARRLQYVSGVCVLDAYLYPSAPGREPVVTYVDARLPSGDDFDRASCVAALSRRKEAR